MTKATSSDWAKLAKHLRQVSREICRDNNCTAEEHCCESYAYVAEDGTLADVCYPDYFQGWGSHDVEQHGEIAAVPLPFRGYGADLESEVANSLE